MPTKRENIEGIPFVLEYKYLGVPLDSALTLKHLRKLVKEKVKKFNMRVGLVLQQVIETVTKLNFWQAYARWHFDYFSPAIAMCKRFKDFESVFAKSLQKALDLPQHLSSQRLLDIVGVPSLTHMAGHHVRRSRDIILQRYGGYTDSLSCLSKELRNSTDEYKALKKTKAIGDLSENQYRINIRSIIPAIINKEFFGLATGAFLTLRCTEGSQGLVGSWVL